MTVDCAEDEQEFALERKQELRETMENCVKTRCLTHRKHVKHT